MAELCYYDTLIVELLLVHSLGDCLLDGCIHAHLAVPDEEVPFFPPLGYVQHAGLGLWFLIMMSALSFTEEQNLVIRFVLTVE